MKKWLKTLKTEKTEEVQDFFQVKLYFEITRQNGLDCTILPTNDAI